MISIHVDTAGLIPWKQRTGAAARSAARMAGSSAIRAMRAEGSRQIRQRKGIKVSSISKALSIIYPTSKEILLWKVKARSEIMPVAAFSHRQVRSGVSVAINKGSRKILRGGFIATMQSGHKGVFTAFGPKRIITRGTYKGKHRRPIKEAFTTRVSEAFRDAIPAIGDRGRAVFASTFNRVLPFEIAKRAGR